MQTEPIDLIRSFVAEHLDGDIDLLATFPLAKLRNDKVYGCPGRWFDCDDTELMRAIYCVVFKDAWPNLSMENLGDGKLRGDTINTYSTFFGRPWDKPNRFEEIWKPDELFKAKLRRFNQTCYTIGNMMVLPDRRIGEWSINKHRGCHDEWHDYADRFLFAFRKVLLNEPDQDEDLRELVELNKEDFAPYYGEQGWRNFVTLNMLKPFVDNAYVPVIRSRGYTYWRGGYTNRERFFEEASRYIDFSTKFVNRRAATIVRYLKSKCFPQQRNEFAMEAGHYDFLKEEMSYLDFRVCWVYAALRRGMPKEKALEQCRLTEKEYDDNVERVIHNK